MGLDRAGSTNGNILQQTSNRWATRTDTNIGNLIGGVWQYPQTIWGLFNAAPTVRVSHNGGSTWQPWATLIPAQGLGAQDRGWWRTPRGTLLRGLPETATAAQAYRVPAAGVVQIVTVATGQGQTSLPGSRPTGEVAIVLSTAADDAFPFWRLWATSTDDGQTWVRSLGGANLMPGTILQILGTPTAWLALTRDASNVYQLMRTTVRQPTSSSQWTTTLTVTGSPPSFRNILRMGQLPSGRLVLAIPGTTLGIYTSDDDGQTWTQRVTGPNLEGIVAVEADTPPWAYALNTNTLAVSHSEDGITWTPSGGQIPYGANGWLMQVVPPDRRGSKIPRLRHP